MDRRWIEDRRGMIDARMRALDFFGTALEQDSVRERFWPAYEGLAEIILSLRQAIMACTEAGSSGESSELDAARRHADDAALQLYMLAEDAGIRQWVGEDALQTMRLDELHPSRLTAIRSCGPEGMWDELLSAYDTVFERIRLANIAHRRDEMDQ